MNPQARLGAFVLIALIVLGVMSSRIGHIVLFKEERHVVEAEFTDLQGLEVEAPVLMSGVNVGYVQEILLRNNKAVVRIALNPEVRLPASTVAHIATKGMVGEKYLALRAKPGDTQWLPDGALIPTEPSYDFNTMMNKLGVVAEDLHRLANGLNRALGEGGKGSLTATLGKIHDAATSLDAMVRENRRHIDQLMTNLDESSVSLKKELPAILRSIRNASEKVSIFLDEHINELSHAVERLPGAVDTGQGFFHDGRQTFQDLDQMLVDNRENFYRLMFALRRASENLEALSDDLRRNPWKLMHKQPEVPPSPRDRKARLEEMLLIHGRMGFVPAHR